MVDFIKFIISLFLSAVSLFTISKMIGQKQLNQLDFFDHINGITIGSIAAEFATELETPLYPLIAMVIYGVIAYVLTIITHKFQKMRKYINGTPTIIMNNETIYRENKKIKLIKGSC